MLRLWQFRITLSSWTEDQVVLLRFTFEFKSLRRSGRLASRTKRSYESMQSANKKSGKLLEKLKLAVDKPATDESATDEPPSDKPVGEPATLESINDPAIIKPHTIGPLETSREATRREGTDETVARSALVGPIEDDETSVGGTLESDLPTITHTVGIAIWDGYFPKSAIDSTPLNGAVALDELPISIAHTACRDSPLGPSIQSHAPEALSAGLNTVFSNALGNLDPN